MLIGYPAVPKQTVNEWYDQQVESGFFPGPSTQNHQTKQTVNPEDEVDKNADEDIVMDDEDARQKQISKDEYLDSHRRGWGNRHGKG